MPFWSDFCAHLDLSGSQTLRSIDLNLNLDLNISKNLSLGPDLKIENETDKFG